MDETESEVTIYKNAVQPKRKSSSSEEGMDTSDEMVIEPGNANQPTDNDFPIQRYIAEPDVQMRSVVDRGRQHENTQNSYNHRGNDRALPPRRDFTPQQPKRGAVMLREAEAAKGRIYDVPGKDAPNLLTTIIDDDYIVIGSHIDDSLRQRIGNGEYVDFAKLLPRDRITGEEDNQMEMINQGGMSFWVPVSDCDNQSINSFSRWELAFRIFSKIFTSFHPSKAGELIQYNHTIYTAAQTFPWDNVYRYDREFRLHMSRYPLQRSWAIILQQAWSMFLKDKVSNTPGQNFSRQGSGRNGQNGQGGSVKRKLCFDFNLEICNFGSRCKFDHRCSFCDKYGHGSYNCRKARRQDRCNSGDSGSNNYGQWDKYERDHQQHKQNHKNNNNGNKNN